MSYELKMLADGSCPPESPLYRRTLSVEQDYEEFSSWDGGFWEDDPEWEYTDDAGHDHYRNGDEYPTLRKVEELVGYCDGDVCMCHEDDYYQCYTQTTYECIGCGEYIKAPGKRFEYGSRHRPVSRHFFLDGEPISYPDLQEIIGIHNRIVEETAARG